MSTNAKVAKVDLPAEIFDVQVSIPLIHQVVVAQQAAARQGTHSTKTRADVRGGGRKPYKQKGTGRARQGSTRAPQFAGGGVVHGPQPRDYDQRTPKKMKAAALKGALTDRAANGRIHVVESLVSGTKPSTRDAIGALASLSDRRRFLVVLERGDNVTWLSLRNAPDVHILAVDQLNTYDVLHSDDVVFTKGSFDALVAGTPKGKSVKAVAAESETTEAPATEVTAFAAVDDADHAGGAQPLENGEAPEGYEIKGNKDSMKYHAPGGRWYDATVAEVWFKTAADAEAAGFVEAGKKAAATEEDDK
ncbi:50S ribosomal protein L4, sunset domain variant [Nocardioides jensenii]|uniref:50S ribosomal protein L4, sunset domain variant n=1 Tax=Nocardioides jensenii TaxID=1843 RepID=UPI00082CA887|nr:50S ribosomal protein L4 [Nocardioides jensenii]